MKMTGKELIGLFACQFHSISQTIVGISWKTLRSDVYNLVFYPIANFQTKILIFTPLNVMKLSPRRIAWRRLVQPAVYWGPLSSCSTYTDIGKEPISYGSRRNAHCNHQLVAPNCVVDVASPDVSLDRTSSTQTVLYLVDLFGLQPRIIVPLKAGAKKKISTL